MPTDKKSIREYNKNFQEWLNKKGLGHSHLEKPAMYSQLGNVQGRTILCVGCGGGEECAHIKSLGAKKVIGVDISKSLIERAKEKFPDIEFYVMDMEKLKFPESSFDLVYSSLVLHYVKNWIKVLSEIKRVLKKNGFFLFSTHNPTCWSAYKKEDKDQKLQILGFKENKKTNKIEIYGDYLNTRKINDIWHGTFRITYYHKSFSSIIKDILKSGLKIVDCIEPRPINSAKKINYEFWKKSSKIPLFIIFKLQK